MSEYCKCGGLLSDRLFRNRKIKWCDLCSRYDVDEIECEHDYHLVLFTISNGSKQLRQYCKKCKELNNKPLKQSEYDLNKIPVRSLDEYHKYIEQSDSQVYDFIKSIKDKFHISFRAKYDNYIKAPEWKALRSIILKRDDYICVICHKAATEVHHLTYAHLDHEYLFELVSLCSECHLNEYTLNENNKHHT